MSDPSKQTFKEGDWAMHGDTIVRVGGTNANGVTSVQYWAPRSSDPRGPMYCGGYGSVFKSLHPVTDPVARLRIALTQATIKLERAQRDAKDASDDVDRLKYALSVALPAAAWEEQP